MHLGYLRLRELLEEFEKERRIQGTGQEAPRQPSLPERWRRRSHSPEPKS